MHYGRPAVCRVPRTHGKGRITHGEVFAVGSTRQTTDGNLVWRSKGCLPYVRCRAHIKHFAVCQKSDGAYLERRCAGTVTADGLRVPLCRVPHVGPRQRVECGPGDSGRGACPHFDRYFCAPILRLYYLDSGPWFDNIFLHTACMFNSLR